VLSSERGGMSPAARAWQRPVRHEDADADQTRAGARTSEPTQRRRRHPS